MFISSLRVPLDCVITRSSEEIFVFHLIVKDCTTYGPEPLWPVS